MSGEPPAPAAPPEPDPEEPPPILGTWMRAYGVVLGELVVVVALLYALARWAE